MYNKTTNKKPVLGYEIDHDKFWSCVDIGNDGECWPWLRAHNTSGYGLFSVRNNEEEYDRTGRAFTQILAHRVSAALVHGLKKDQYVMHKCDNRACCNPAHLQVGSQMDNVMDMISKGRGFWQK